MTVSTLLQHETLGKPDHYGTYAPALAVSTKTANFTAVAGGVYEVDASAGPVVATVPNGAGVFCFIKKVDATTNAVAITPASGTIDGAAVINLTAQYEARETVGDGTNVFALSERKVFGSPSALGGAASDGTSNKVPRTDHVHDVSLLAPKSSPQFSGNVKIVNNASGAVTPIIELDGFGRQFQGPMIDTSNAGGGRDLVLVDMFNFRQISDLVITNGSVAVTSALQARFGIKDNGQAVTGPGIPAGTTLVWVAGTDSATAARMSQAATASGTITAIIGNNNGSLTDLFYVNEGGGQGVSFGFGITPPSTSHRVTIAADDVATTQGNLRFRIGPSQTGDIITVIDSGGATKNGMDSNGRWYGKSVRCTDRTTTSGQVALSVTDETGSSVWSLGYAGSGSSVLRLRYTTGGVTVLDVNTDGSTILYKNCNLQGTLTLSDAKNISVGATTGTIIATATTQKLGFFAKTPVVQPSGTPAAATDLATVISLANSLRTNLLALGLVA